MNASTQEAGTAEARADAAATRWSVHRASVGYFAMQVVVIGAFLALWQIVSDSEIVDPFFVSSPAAIASQLYEWFSSGSVWQHIVVTNREALVGWVLGSIVGIVIGFLLGRFSSLDRIFSPLLHLLNTLPRVALAPLFIVWFGIDELSKVLLVVTIIVFIMVFNTRTGVVTVNQDYIRMARLLGAGERQLITEVVFPWCIPWIFVGLRLGLAWSLSGAVVGEFVAARAGLGFLIFRESARLNNDGVLAGCVLLLATATIFLILMSLAEGRLLRWRPT